MTQEAEKPDLVLKAALEFMDVAICASPEQMADFARAQLEEAVTIALEQRCERGTPWDLAILAVVRAIREHFHLEGK